MSKYKLYQPPSGLTPDQVSAFWRCLVTEHWESPSRCTIASMDGWYLSLTHEDCGPQLDPLGRVLGHSGLPLRMGDHGKL